MQIARCLQGVCVFCLILFLSCPLALHAQSKPKSLASLIRSSIETKTETWSRESPLSVAVKIKNTSKGPVDLVGGYSFHLTRADDPSIAYWSPVNVLDGSPGK